MVMVMVMVTDNCIHLIMARLSLAASHPHSHKRRLSDNYCEVTLVTLCRLVTTCTMPTQQFSRCTHCSKSTLQVKICKYRSTAHYTEQERE